MTAESVALSGAGCVRGSGFVASAEHSIDRCRSIIPASVNGNCVIRQI